jgi:hypothetical protein
MGARRTMAEWWEVGVDAGVKLASVVVNNIFAAKQKGAQPQLMSPGLAVGYYANFIEPMGQLLNVGEIELFENEEPRPDEIPLKFDLENTNFQIIIPSRLNGQAFKLCLNEFDRSKKGWIFLKANKRKYGYNYRIDNFNGKSTLTIIDLARPTFALKKYYEDILKMETSAETSGTEWRELQQAELSAFEKMLRTLQQRGYAELEGKISFLKPS